MSDAILRVNVRREVQILTPIRFVRAGAGTLQAGVPDIDDRGFAMDTRPSTWGITDARGAMVGITEGEEVAIGVLREEIGPDAQLFATVDPPNLVQVTAPNAGQPLPTLPMPVGHAPRDVFRIRGLQDQANQCGKVQMRLGSPTGPVLGEMEVHIFARKVVRIKAWLVTIQGIGPNLGLLPPAVRQPGDDLEIPIERYREELARDFESMRRIFLPAGIDFQFDPARVDRFSIDRTLPSHGNRPFLRPGKVNDLHGTGSAEFSSVINTRFVNDAINIYFVHRGLGFTAATFSPAVRRPQGFGIVVADRYKVRFAPPNPEYILAHEIGHYLGSEHVDQIFRDGDRKPIRGDMWTLRNLDFSHTFNHRNPPHHNDTGYGPQQPGMLIHLKNLRPDPTLGAGSQVDHKRRRVRLGV